MPPLTPPSADSAVQDAASAYDTWSAHYDSDANVTRDLDAAVVRRAPLRIAGRDVLEIGCGTGKNTIWLASAARTLVAMDFSNGMLAIARDRVRSETARFVQHDVRDPWPVPSGSIDVVVGNLVLEHVEFLSPVFVEAARVLHQGGQLFVCELHPFKQLVGGQARFTDPGTGAVIRVQAFRHSVSDYVNAGLSAGLVLRELGEWADADAEQGAPPRLLSVLFDAP